MAASAPADPSWIYLRFGRSLNDLMANCRGGPNMISTSFRVEVEGEADLGG
jgi:hypothetical protein